MQTFINLPEVLERKINTILSGEDRQSWMSAASGLHERYLTHNKGKKDQYLANFSDALAYIALRFPATYAQISAAMLQVKEVMPSWEPKSLLELGGGPGTGIFAAQSVWNTLATATNIDLNEDLLQLGREMTSEFDNSLQILWQQADVRTELVGEQQYDLVLLANVLNELRPNEIDKVIGKAFNLTNGVLLIVEPGTQHGNNLVSVIAKKFRDAGFLIAPYVQNSYVSSDEYWIHFSQRFIRPDFQRSIRQQLRESILMASDWEDAKYSYVAISKNPSENNSWGRCIGPVKKQKGFLEVPLLTKDGIEQVKVMKRQKQQYTFAKELKWGGLIEKEIYLQDK